MDIGEKMSRILVIGGTGIIGRHLVAASMKAGHPTSMLVRPATMSADPEKAKLVQALENSGAALAFGDISDHERLVRLIRQVDVVISAVGHKSEEEIESQLNIVAAIKEAGNVKRFVPSEFGCDVEQAKLVDPAKTILGAKVRLRHVIRTEGIPHTIISNNLLHSFFLPRMGHPEADPAPVDKVSIFGDGNQQAIFVDENDMFTYTIKAVDDPRTLNKILHVRPPANFYTLNQLVSLWEKKIGKVLERDYVSGEEILKKIPESTFPLNFQLAIGYTVFVNGELSDHKVDPLTGVEATELYPDVKYTTVEEYLDCLL